MKNKKDKLTVDILKEKFEKHGYRIEAFRKMREIQKAMPSTYIKMEENNNCTFPVWKLYDKKGRQLASVASVHVVHGAYNTFVEGLPL